MQYQVRKSDKKFDVTALKVDMADFKKARTKEGKEVQSTMVENQDWAFMTISMSDPKAKRYDTIVMFAKPDGEGSIVCEAGIPNADEDKAFRKAGETICKSVTAAK